MSENMVRVELGGESREVAREEWTKAADELVALFPNAGAPKVTTIGGETTLPAPALEAEDVPGFAPAALAVAALEEPAAQPTISRRAPVAGLRIAGVGALEVEGGRMDLIGQARSTIDKEAAEAVGFAVAPTIYDRGTRVIDTGIANAIASRQEWEAMPLARENCAALAQRIQAEDREDSVSLIRQCMMQDDGRIYAAHVDEPAAVSKYSISEPAFGSFVQRMNVPGGSRYLVACWPELRAHNVNEWVARIGAAEKRAEAAAHVAKVALQSAPLDVRFRHRLPSRPEATDREIFAVVGPGYADFDADQISEALAIATPPEARGRVTYDGRRTRWEILFQSTVQPRHFVAGEFFRAGVIVKTDDTGGGALIGNAVLWQNLCLNLIIVDVAETAHFAIRHTGEVGALADKFRKQFARAMGSIDHFLRAWDYAVEDDVIANVSKVAQAAGRSVPTDAEEFMAGIFRDTIERELVPVRGRKTEDAVRGLMKAWGEDTSGAAGPTRAAVANAFTRYAHASGTMDPWAEDEIQRGAGSLLRRTRKDDAFATSLGFLAPEDVK